MSDVGPKFGSLLDEDGPSGSCLVANSPQGLGDLMIKRRIDGKSWGEIAEEFGLPNPSAARSKFTKLTGITDYKVKGKELKNLVDNNLLDQIKGTSAKVAKKAVKEVDDAVTVGKAFDTVPGGDQALADNLQKALEKSTGWSKSFTDQVYSSLSQDMGSFKGTIKEMIDKNYKHLSEETREKYKLIWDTNKLMDQYGPNSALNAIDDIKSVAQVAAKSSLDKDWTDWKLSQKAKADVSHIDKASDIIEDYKNGQTSYLKLTQKHGVSFNDVDQAVWNHLMDVTDGDVWKAYKLKPTSEVGFQRVKSTVFEFRAKGMTEAEIKSLTDIDSFVIKLIIKDEWSLPAPGATSFVTAAPVKYTPYTPPTPTVQPPIHPGYDYKSESYWTKWTEGLGNDLTSDELSYIRRYTGSEYGDFNNWLRGKKTYYGKREDWNDMSRGMSSSMRPAPEDIRVTRFVSQDAFPSDLSAIEGTVYADPAFMSTTIVERGTYGAGKEIKMIIDVPQGTPIRYVDGISSNQGEKELIMDRNTAMIVTKVDRRPGGYNVYLKVVQ